MNILKAAALFYKLAIEESHGRQLFTTTIMSLSRQFQNQYQISNFTYYIQFDKLPSYKGGTISKVIRLFLSAERIRYQNTWLSIINDFDYNIFISIVQKMIKKQFSDIKVNEAWFSEYTNEKSNLQIIRDIIEEAFKDLIEKYNEMFYVIKELLDSDDFIYANPSQENYSLVSYTVSNNKRTTTLGSYIKNRIKRAKKIPDNIIDLFVNEYAAIISVNINIEKHIKLLEKEDIVDFYAENKVNISSCMAGANASKTRFYALNPDKVRLVTFENKARALLWTCDDGTVVLDRVYPSGCVYAPILKHWAVKNGYIYRGNLGSYVSDTVDLSDDSKRYITMKHQGTFPYIDTFKYGKFVDGDYNSGRVILCNDCDFGDLIFDREDGFFSGGNVVRCDGCRGIVSDAEVISYEYEIFCRDCFDERFGFCESCGDVYTLGELKEAKDKTLCTDCFDKKFITCYECDQAEEIDDCIIPEDTDRVYCNHCGIEKTERCEICDRTVEQFTVMHTIDDYEYAACEDCINNKPLGDNICNKCNKHMDYELKEISPQSNKSVGVCKNCYPDLYSEETEEGETKEISEEIKEDATEEDIEELFKK